MASYLGGGGGSGKMSGYGHKAGHSLQKCAQMPRSSRAKAIAGKASVNKRTPGRGWTYSNCPTDFRARVKGV